MNVPIKTKRKKRVITDQNIPVAMVTISAGEGEETIDREIHFALRIERYQILEMGVSLSHRAFWRELVERMVLWEKIKGLSAANENGRSP